MTADYKKSRDMDTLKLKSGQAHPSPAGQKHALYRNYRLGDMFEQAYEMHLTRADVIALQQRFPGRYDALTYWQSEQELAETRNLNQRQIIIDLAIKALTDGDSVTGTALLDTLRS